MLAITMGAPGEFWALGYHAGLGKLFSTNSNSNPKFFYEIDTTDGHATLIGPTGTGLDSINDLLYDPITDRLYGITDGFPTDKHYILNTTTGFATLIAEDMGGNLGGVGGLGLCGNESLDPGEECDDGNNEDKDDCSADCLLPNCGDGLLDPLEECDDGGESVGCDDDCSFSICGDGHLNTVAVAASRVVDREQRLLRQRGSRHRPLR